jgi:hypothetical protein
MKGEAGRQIDQGSTALNSASTSKRTPHFTITKINILTLFKEIIPVYAENHRKPANTE